MINYVTQTQGEKIGNKIVCITNLTPQFSVDEKREVKLQIEAIDTEISSLLEKISAANDKVMQYINNRVAELDAEKKEINTQILSLDNNHKNDVGEISGYLEHWYDLTVSDKITVVDCLIERITASKDSIEIKWKI